MEFEKNKKTKMITTKRKITTPKQQNLGMHTFLGFEFVHRTTFTLQVSRFIGPIELKLP